MHAQDDWEAAHAGPDDGQSSMTWVKIDDEFHRNPKAANLSNGAVGLWLRSLSYANDNLTDGLLPDGWIRRHDDGRDREAVMVAFLDQVVADGGGSRESLALAAGAAPAATLRQIASTLGARSEAEELLEAGFWDRDEEGRVWIHDYGDYQPLRADVLRSRDLQNRRRALHRDRALISAIKKRDGSTCRLCARRVDWADRRGAVGGTYAYIDPAVDNSLENVIVACRGCCADLDDRAVEEAGMTVLEPRASRPDRRPDPRSDPDQTHVRPRSEPPVALHSEERPDLSVVPEGSERRQHARTDAPAGAPAHEGPRRASLFEADAEDLIEPEPLVDVPPAPARPVVDGRRATRAEWELAQQVLDEINRVGGTRYSADSHLRKIVMRIREVPKMQLDHHKLVIGTVYGLSWWRTRVWAVETIYGNQGHFQKCVTETAAIQQGARPSSGNAVDERMRRLAEGA
jgi:hypothetical protein